MLGLRHGLDPDHVAVIDSLTFRAVDEHQTWAPWVGSLFALGHSLSVAFIAVGVSLVSARFEWPSWVAQTTDWAAILLLIIVGTLNLRALRRSAVYAPAGWRQALIPSVLRGTSHPLAVVSIGVVFGLVFDTATQAATWGLAASSRDGVLGAVVVSAMFAAGMITTDTADSQIVARLLKAGGDAARVVRYRRGVGWLIVALSFGMAGYALATKLSAVGELPPLLTSVVGAAMTSTIILTLYLTTERPVRDRSAGMT